MKLKTINNKPLSYAFYKLAINYKMLLSSSCMQIWKQKFQTKIAKQCCLKIKTKNSKIMQPNVLIIC